MPSISLMSRLRSMCALLRREVSASLPYLVLRGFFQQGEYRRVVPVAPALGLRRFEHLVHDGRDRQDHTVLPARCKGYTQILVVQFYPETRLEVVGEELLLLGLHHRAARQPPGERLHQLLRRDTAPGTQHERLGDGLDGKRDHDLVARLDHLTGPDGSNMRRHLPHHVEQWASTLEVLLRTAHHDGESALYGPHVASGDRRIQHRGALLSDLLRKLLGDHGRDRAHVHEQRAVADAFENAALSSHHGLNVRRVGEHGDNDVACLRHLSRASGGGGVSSLCQFLRLLLAAVVDDQLVARVHQVLRHRPAHDPKPYKTYRVSHVAPLSKVPGQIRSLPCRALPSATSRSSLRSSLWSGCTPGRRSHRSRAVPVRRGRTGSGSPPSPAPRGLENLRSGRARCGRGARAGWRPGSLPSAAYDRSRAVYARSPARHALRTLRPAPSCTADRARSRRC